MALALGKTKKELRDSVDAAEYQEWQIYDDMYLLPDRRMDLQLATLAWAQCTSKDAKPTTFMIDPPEKPKQTVKQQAAICQGIAATDRLK